MLNAEKARERTENSTKKELELELEKIGVAVEIMCDRGKRELCLSSGLTEKGSLRQEEIFPNFKWLLAETIATLQGLGYEVITNEAYPGGYAKIKW